MNRLLKYLLALAVIITATACGDDDNGGTAGELCESVVTFTGNREGVAWFEYRKVGDSPLITLHGNGHLDEKEVEPGTRLLMRYYAGPDMAADGGEVSIIGLQRVLTDTVETVAVAPESIGPLYLTAIERSGEYLNIYSQMPAVKGRKITVEAISTPATDGTMELYISATAPDDPTAYRTTTVASLWIGPVWNKAGTTGVTVHIDNTNNIYRKVFTFLKND